MIDLEELLMGKKTVAGQRRLCPVERAGMLDVKLRKMVHHPEKLLRPYIGEGMKVLDLGCGPGFFSVEMAKMVGQSGKIIAADLQAGMLEKLKAKIKDTDLEKVIELHQCQDADHLGLSETVDFVLLFYMLHEVPDQSAFLQGIKSLLNPEGKVLIVEPKFHVSKKAFADSFAILKQLGFDWLAEPKIFFSRAVVIKI